jgi:hypothetical protein
MADLRTTATELAGCLVAIAIAAFIILMLYVFRRDTWVAGLVVLDVGLLSFLVWVQRDDMRWDSRDGKTRLAFVRDGALFLSVGLIAAIDIAIILVAVVFKGVGAVISAVHHVLGNLP